MRFAHERLLEARLGLGLTQEQLATALGVDVRTYRRYEAGAVNVGGFCVRHRSRQRLLDRMCAELGLDPEELVLDEPHRGPEPRAEPPPGPHVLPPARAFVGRQTLVADLSTWIQDRDDARRVIALIAIGGAGKTALAQRVGHGAFTWSFYQDDRCDALIDALLSRLGQPLQPHGTRLERLEHALTCATPLLILLDGLERVQADGTGDRARGELADPVLRRLLRAIAAGLGTSKVLITSRYPVLDLQPWSASTHASIPLPPMAPHEATALLSSWGLSDPAALADRVGGHALSLAVVGAYVRECLGGRSDRYRGLELSEARRDSALARRLHDVLSAHVSVLTPLERSVLGALAIFPGGAAPPALASVPLEASPEALGRAVERLVASGLVQGDPLHPWLHPFVAQFARTLLVDGGAALHEAERVRLSATLSHPPRGPDPQLLDRYEALLHHTLGAGHPPEAYRIYQRVLGGFGHLGLQLGEMARGARITRTLAAALPRDHAALIRYDHALYALALGDLQGALFELGRLCQVWAARHDQVVWITALRTTAYAQRLAGELDAARTSVETSIGLAQALDDVSHEIRGLALLGAILHDQDQLDHARECFAAVRALGDEPVARRGLWEAEHLLDLGALELAQARTEHNLARCRDRGWGGHVAHCHAVLGTIAARRGDLDAAEAHRLHLRGWTEHTGEVELVLREHLLAAELGDQDQARLGRDKAARLGYRLLEAHLAARLGASLA